MMETFADAYMQYLFFPTTDPSREARKFNFDVDPQARSKMGETQNAPPELERLKSSGTKLIVYQGLADHIVPPDRTIQWWNQAAGSVGGAKSLEAFAKFYVMPDMDHCRGGRGPNDFGGVSQPPPPAADSKNDLLTALDQWVTKGVAPAEIVARNMKGTEVQRTRPLCPYPLVAKYKGAGSIDEAANFTCKAPQ
jgi:feruloyl esterase